MPDTVPESHSEECAETELQPSSVQTPALTSCSSTEKVQVSDVTITDAKIDETMVVNFTLAINEDLTSDPTLTIELRNKDSIKVPCISDVGSCIYMLCGGRKPVEKQLGRLWKNKCPVEKMTAQQSIRAELRSFVQMIIGKAPTTMSVKLEVKDGGKVAGCQSFNVDVAAK
ncbi:uncharacterized protein LOC144142978 [Haemaphysalis longicornis]